MWLYDICHPTLRQESYKRMTNVTQSQERLPCIVIIDSLHRISCGIVIIHLTIANSQGEACDMLDSNSAVEPPNLYLAVKKLRQRNWLFHPVKSYPSPSATVSFDSMKRMNLCNDVIFISSVGYDSSSHQPFRKEAVTNQIASRSLAYQLLIYQCL